MMLYSHTKNSKDLKQYLIQNRSALLGHVYRVNISNSRDNRSIINSNTKQKEGKKVGKTQ